MTALTLRVPVDVITFEITRHLQAACRHRRLQCLIIGAMARVIFLEHVLGLGPERATRDVDFAIAVDSWETFANLKGDLERTGHFVASTGQEQRLHFFSTGNATAGGIAVDLVPFGGLEKPPFTINWPRDVETQLNVVGYADALASAVEVALSEDLHVRVASLPGQALLKISAWADRRLRTDAKDALDLLILLRTYERAGDQGRIYEQDPELCESLDWQPELMGAHLLGTDAMRLASAETRDQIQAILSNPQLRSQLERDMARGMPGKDDAMSMSEELVAALARGFGVAS